MADYASKATDGVIESLERRIRKVYTQAQKDIEKKTRDFWERHRAKDAMYRKQLEEGKITEEQYQAWLRGQVFQGKQWDAKMQQVEQVLANANKQALSIINGGRIQVFATNSNWQSYIIEKTAGVNFGFGVYDADTVTRLLRDEPDLLPAKRLNIRKDKAWNRGNLNRQISQGIIQGEGLDDIAKRLRNVTDMNRNQSYTNARTMMTNAQNAGRQESYQRAKTMGIKVKKRWLATLDGHTRTNHRKLDGQTVDIDEPFKIGGYSIMYPGDRRAKPEMVYNCRCTMISEVVDYPSEDAQRYDNVTGKPIKDMTYKEWEKHKKGGTPKPEETKPKSSRLPDVPSIDEIVKVIKRGDLFDGYDSVVQGSVNAVLYEKLGIGGAPRVVDQLPDGYTVMYRGIGDGDKTAEEYFDQLKHGRLYARESTSGAGVVFAKTGSKDEDIRLATSMARGNGVIVEAALDKSANLIKYDRLQRLADDFSNNPVRQELIDFATEMGNQKMAEAFSTMDRRTYNEGQAYKELASRLENNEKGLVAILNGYDGVDSDTWTEYSIFNRRKLIIKRRARKIGS